MTSRAPTRNVTERHWRFYVWAMGAQPPPKKKSCTGPLNYFQGNLDLNNPEKNLGGMDMFDVIGFIVISLSRCCLPNDEGPGPPNISPITAPAERSCHPSHLISSELISTDPISFEPSAP